MNDPRPEDRPAPLDEHSALAALERMQEAIRKARHQRETKLDEFDAFLRAGRVDRLQSSVAAVESAARREPVNVPSGQAPVEAPAASPAFVGTVAAPPPQASVGASVREPFADVAPPWDRRESGGRSMRWFAIPGVAVVVIVIGLLFAHPWRKVAIAPAPDRVVPAPQPAAATKPIPPVPPLMTPPTPAHAVDVELTATARVWVRVVADGQHLVERELRPGEVVHAPADRAVVVRAGNAGALRVTVDGRDMGLMGREGQVLTRTFTR